MAPKKQALGVEDTISKMLFWGVNLSTGLIALGWMSAISQDKELHDPDLMNHVLPGARTLQEIAQGDLSGLVLVGLLLLLSLPLLHVILTFLIFTKHREWVFSGLSFWILTTLVLSLVFGVGH